jgi:hypothetical protein
VCSSDLVCNVDYVLSIIYHEQLYASDYIGVDVRDEVERREKLKSEMGGKSILIAEFCLL